MNKGQGRVEGDTQPAYVRHAGWEERALDLEEHRRWKEAIGTGGLEDGEGQGGRMLCWAVQKSGNSGEVV